MEQLIIKSDATLLTGIKKMDEIKRKLLIVYHDNIFFSLLTIGDIQRAILKNVDIATTSIYDELKQKHIDVCYVGEPEDSIVKRCFFSGVNLCQSLTLTMNWKELFFGKTTLIQNKSRVQLLLL
jgi:hypothetical protein